MTAGWLSRLRAWRPELATETVILLASLVLLAFYNRALWRLLFPAGLATLAEARVFGGLFVAVAALYVAAFSLFLTRRTVRPVLAVLFLATAFASFYMDHYTVFLNTEMLRNILHTDPAEAHELLTPPLFLHVLLYGALPIWVLTRVRIAARPRRRTVLIRSGVIAVALLVAVTGVFTQYREVSSLVRSHRDARHLITPVNYLASLFRIAKASAAEPEGPRSVIAADATRAMATGRRPVLLVLAIGETARADNFGLSGYARQNTPELAQLDLAVFPRVQACGTSTEVSVPCLFAPIGRRDYDADRISREESLLNVLARVGMKVVWIDNQSGCKGVCDGLPQRRLNGNVDPTFCDGERCLDGIMLPELQRAVAGETGDLVVVLHMLGNHGPAYSRRYPPEFRRYAPTCEELDISECSQPEIVNAYDNAILYTDHVLASLIHYLAGMSSRDTGLIYVSDHGESLGENGLYLHGLPWRIAPATQREVPMLVWLSDGIAASEQIDRACLKAKRTAAVTHDHFFHSVLGLLDVSTRTREPALDLFGSCRRA